MRSLLPSASNLQMLDVLRESQPEQYADIMAQLQASAGGPAGAGVSWSRKRGSSF